MNNNGHPSNEAIASSVGGLPQNWTPNMTTPGDVSSWKYERSLTSGHRSLAVPDGMTLDYREGLAGDFLYVDPHGGYGFANSGQQVDKIYTGTLFCEPSWYRSHAHPIWYGAGVVLFLLLIASVFLALVGVWRLRNFSLKGFTMGYYPDNKFMRRIRKG